MAETTNIEWADATFNPWIGCTEVSPACARCYAKAWAERHGRAGLWNTSARQRTTAGNWRQPMIWDADAARANQRRRVFCASLADVFDNEVPPAWRKDLLELIGRTSYLDWLLLTKRIGNAHSMLDIALDELSHGLNSWAGHGQNPWENVWLGATVVTQAEADRDIPKLLATPAARRFLSIEPMLEPIDLQKWIGSRSLDVVSRRAAGLPYERQDIHWVIVGGESGPGARPMSREWVRSIRDQCQDAGIAFLFKQWGEWVPTATLDDRTIAGYYRATRNPQRLLVDGKEMLRLGKKHAGRVLDGVTHTEFPEPAL